LNDVRLPSRAHSSLFKGIQALEAGTCLKFVPRSIEKDYIDFFVGDGCYSQVGRKGGRQEISLASGCWYSHTVSHEVSLSKTYYPSPTRLTLFFRLCMLWASGMSKCDLTVMNMS